MPESRDRLSRPVDIAALFASRRSGSSGIYHDQPELDFALFGSPRPTPVAAVAFPRRGGLTTPRHRSFNRSPANGRENIRVGSVRRGRPVRVLPRWYPRTPLRDITAVVRLIAFEQAIERTRERLGRSEGQETGSPIAQDHPTPGSSSAPDAHLEHSNTITTPLPTLGLKRCPPTVGKVPMILLDITNQPSVDSEALTPQKKLLNSIDTVEKVVMEELQKMKRTPSVKRADREKKVRTLMSMR
ncbi:hypothetical protein K2173_003770 [Erythroxylum novogranatense]|uniref:Protein POLYCHOME n=1 Tax=Erythroxylum novogranatense TaxID=1862640 RepID=A0AAV8SIT7_9ROSI|nr:hypothetical protein K2173_003770 [Erythroxylum novogranatense]